MFLNDRSYCSMEVFSVLKGLFEDFCKIGTLFKFSFSNKKDHCHDENNSTKIGSKKVAIKNNNVSQNGNANINQQGGINIISNRNYYSVPMEKSSVPSSASEVPKATYAKPELHLAILGGNVFIPDGHSLTGIALDTRVWNTGVHSVVTSWDLVVMPKGTIPTIAQLTPIPEIIRVNGMQNSAIIRASNALDSKVKATPVGPIPVEGILLFYVKLPQHIVLDDDTKLVLTAKDIFDVETCKVQRMGDWLKR
jgi:hypothetical protein